MFADSIYLHIWFSGRKEKSTPRQRDSHETLEQSLALHPLFIPGYTTSWTQSEDAKESILYFENIWGTSTSHQAVKIAWNLE